MEVPDLAGCLTLNKNDFLRAGVRGATYLAYRKSLQEAATRQLAAWDEARPDAETPPRALRLDRDLERVLEDLAGEFPLLHSLVERRPGGQKRLPMPDGRGDDAYRSALLADQGRRGSSRGGRPTIDRAVLPACGRVRACPGARAEASAPTGSRASAAARPRRIPRRWRATRSRIDAPPHTIRPGAPVRTARGR